MDDSRRTRAVICLKHIVVIRIWSALVGCVRLLLAVGDMY